VRFLAFILPLLASVPLQPSARAVAVGEISFARDVMPVISRANCNGGGCHGHRDGKGGFKLSLWGESPALDLKALVESEKRANVRDPLASRILRKPTLQTEHEGGKRFDTDSPEFRILRQWLETGAPDDTATAPALVDLAVTPESHLLVEPETEIQVKVEATFANGETRDVTYWSVYSLSNLDAEVSRQGRVRFAKPGETSVLVRYLDRRVSARLAHVPARPDFVWGAVPEANSIDTQGFGKLRAFRMNPSDVCDDATFVRRAFLAIIGVLPTADKARAFVGDPDPAKRAKLVDALLARPEYAINRRSWVWSGAGGAGARPSALGFSRINPSMGFSAGFGTPGRTGLSNDQCFPLGAPSSIHRRITSFSPWARGFRCESGGGIISSSSSVMGRRQRLVYLKGPGLAPIARFAGGDP